MSSGQDQPNNRRQIAKEVAAQRPANIRGQSLSSNTSIPSNHRLSQSQRPVRNAPGPPPLIPGNQVDPALRKEAVVAQNPTSQLIASEHIGVALQHARTTTPGHYIGQDSKFGNLILPVLPEFSKDK